MARVPKPKKDARSLRIFAQISGLGVASMPSLLDELCEATCIGARMPRTTQSLGRRNSAGINIKRKTRILIAAVVGMVILVLYFAPIYYNAPEYCSLNCSPSSASPVSHWTTSPHYSNRVAYGAVYFFQVPPAGCFVPGQPLIGQCTPQPHYVIYLWAYQWNITL